MTKGTILRLIRERGFGFIRTEKGDDLFFHAVGVKGEVPFDLLQEGQAVTFDKERDPRGRGERAVNVQPA